MLSHKAQFLLVIKILHEYQDEELSESRAANLLDLDILGFRTLLNNRYPQNLQGETSDIKNQVRENAGDFAQFRSLLFDKEWDAEESYSQLKSQFEITKEEK